MVIQHGAFRRFKGIRQTFITSLKLKFPSDKSLVSDYFLDYENSTKSINIGMIERDSKFKTVKPCHEKSVFFGTNPNHFKENERVIKLL